jgi:hypothetical protein
MKKKNIETVVSGDIIKVNSEAVLVKFIDVNPKTVYIKSHEGKPYSFVKGDIVEVY